MKLEIIAHRGANREAPENTLTAFKRALDAGAQGIELDVHLTSDGHAVVHHDPLLRDGSKVPIASLNLAAVQRRASAPSLDDVLQLVDGRCRVYIEIKASGAVDAVATLVEKRLDWCAVHSFDHRTVLRARTLNARIQTGILLVSYLVDVAGAMRAAGATDVWQNAEFVDRDLVEHVHTAGGRVVAWTVNDTARVRDLAQLGVDAICTDVPRELLKGLNEGVT
ncbi:MAG TPA: glycerophosphodiester phosphodiesterase [Gemmatimonadaceae bacterium]